VRGRVVVVALMAAAALAGWRGVRMNAQRAMYGVELDVVVVDDHGRPVQGLRRGDFKVKDNGKTVAIDSFTERASLGAFGPSDRRFVVLILDDTGVPPGLTVRVQAIARMFIDRIGQDDRVNVVRFNSRSDEATGDRSAALSRIANYTAGMVPHFGRETYENALARVTQISRQLEADEHRRKAIVCIGAPDIFNIDEPIQGSASLIRPYWIDALRAASRANTAVYLIDPEGVTGRVKIRGTASLTAQTGGEAFVNSNDFDGAVAKIWDETSHYYMIAYAPSPGGDDLHDVEVKVEKPGVRVRARKSRG
jgi:VWFA-related protein